MKKGLFCKTFVLLTFQVKDFLVPNMYFRFFVGFLGFKAALFIDRVSGETFNQELKLNFSWILITEMTSNYLCECVVCVCVSLSRICLFDY